MDNDIDDFGIEKIKFHCDIVRSDKKALEYWRAFPGYYRLALLNNAFCSKCSEMTSFDTNYCILKDELIEIKGKCFRCGEAIVRVIE